jgi:mannose-6-phosphate isomerase-like protein (cupin superfamily)
MSPEVTNTKQLTLLTSIISPGSTTGTHKHEVDEFMYVVTGRGEFAEDGRTESFEPDSILFGAANKEHEVKNTGKETMKVICIYSPPLKPAGYFEKAVELARGHSQS